MPLTAEQVLAHMVERCRHIEFFAFTYAYFRARHLPQAIVTVNPDLFSEVIVSLCEFEDVTDVVDTSWDERTVDKGRMCEIALERMGVACGAEGALLIDNKQKCLDEWSQRGDLGYLFRSDDAFKRDVANGIDGLLSSVP